jgi:hypothetical protein
MKAMSTLVEYDSENKIVFLEDISNMTGGITVTNDAENVVIWYRSLFGDGIRIVYKDTDQDWWEIIWTIERHQVRPAVFFKPWHGIEWDILSRKEVQ